MKIEKKFSASEGWLSHWKKKFNIKKYSMSGEKKSADENACENFKIVFRQKFDSENYLPCQIFNADETGLNFKMLPKTTLCEKSYRAVGIKQSKDRVTVMACTNADGSYKLPLVVIGKSAKPRALKNCLDSLPVYYTHQKKAWMNTTIFETWFKEEFTPKVRDFLNRRNVPIKAVLLLDNAPSHPPAERLDQEQITANYFPPNTTSILQPLDQGIIENMKRHYKSKFLRFILKTINNGADLSTVIKSINLKNVIDWLHPAWEEVSSETIFKCWKSVLPPRYYAPATVELESSNENSNQSASSTAEIESNSSLFQLSDETLISQVRQISGFENIERGAVIDWLANADKEDVIVPTNSELIDMVRGLDANDFDEEESTDECHDLINVASAAEIIISYCQKNINFATGPEIELLQKLKEKANTEAKKK